MPTEGNTLRLGIPQEWYMVAEKVAVMAWDCVCPRCEHRWRSYGAERPRKCAGCKDPNWDKPRVRAPRTKVVAS